MTALKTKYAAVSQWMQKHHVRGIYLMIVLYVIVVALLNSSFLTVAGAIPAGLHYHRAEIGEVFAAIFAGLRTLI